MFDVIRAGAMPSASKRLAPRFVFVGALIMSGCGTHVGGWVDPVEGAVQLETAEFAAYTTDGERVDGKYVPQAVFVGGATADVGVVGLFNLVGDPDFAYSLRGRASIWRLPDRDGLVGSYTDWSAQVRTLAAGVVFDWGTHSLAQSQFELWGDIIECRATSVESGDPWPCDVEGGSRSEYAFAVEAPGA